MENPPDSANQPPALPATGEPPQEAVIVNNGKTEAELARLRGENSKLKIAVRKTATAKRKMEVENAHLQDQVHQLKQVPTPAPVKPATEKMSWMGYGR